LQDFRGTDPRATDAGLYRRLCSETTCKNCSVREIDLEFRTLSSVFENAEGFDLFAHNLRTFDKIWVHRLDTSHLGAVDWAHIPASKGTREFLRAGSLPLDIL
jgi:hypothetical protein